MHKYGVCTPLLCFIVFQLITPVVSDFLGKKAAKVDVFKGRCPGHEDAPAYFQNIRIIRLKGVNVKSKRCSSKEAPDSCESMHDLVIPKICDVVNKKNQVWSPFVDSIHPPIDCPMKKGTYTVTNGTFDMGPFAYFPGADKWYWKARSEIFEEDSKTLIMCLTMEGQMVFL